MKFQKQLPKELVEKLESLRAKTEQFPDLSDTIRIKEYKTCEEILWTILGRELLLSWQVDDAPLTILSWDTIDTVSENVVSIRLYSGSENARRVEMYRFLQSPLRLRTKYTSDYQDYLISLAYHAHVSLQKIDQDQSKTKD